MNKTRMITETALLLALALVLQSLRVIVPIAPPITMFVIGTGVNLILLVLAYRVSVIGAVIVGAILPVMAFLEGQLPMIVFCPAVIFANIVFVWLASKWRASRLVWLTPIIKAGILFGLSDLIVEAVGLPTGVRCAILFMMGIGQLITATGALLLEKKLEKYIFSGKNC